ncbi:hypothetical protein [uncultured Draconibacterium sp.]|uniref:hypothetical protein n=1 Tax=uncultured Draconibacterium sp. TaxID=1573823 RepID=UPI002AA6E018|nr:hypothetical protein [uncultured Draconibacterium sp.]
MKQAILIVIFMSISMIIFSQEIVWEKLPFNSVDEINYNNDSLVNMTQIPFDYYENNGLIYRVASTDFPDFQREDWAKNYVDEYIEKNKIKDNGQRDFKYAITWESGYFELKKRKTEKRYYFGEGSGVLDYTVIIEEPGYCEEQIFCIINDTISYPNTKFTLESISPTKENGRIRPNQKCQLKISKSRYILEYTADFCDGHFQSDGFGTISPTFYNMQITVFDSSNNKKQIIWQVPHEHYYGLQDIEVGDINNDEKQDLVLTIVDDLCIKRILYLSNDSNTTELFRYVGTMMIYCDYP